MKTKVFAVYDSKVGEYMTPFHLRTAGEALRAWHDTVNDSKTQFNKHPEDFVLFELAEFDQEKGIFLNHTAPIALSQAISEKKVSPQ